MLSSNFSGRIISILLFISISVTSKSDPSHEFENRSKEIIHTRKDVNTGAMKDFTLKMVNRTHYQTVDEDGKSCVGVSVGGKIII